MSNSQSLPKSVVTHYLLSSWDKNSDGSGTVEDEALATPGPGTVVEPTDESCATYQNVEALLYVDLSLSSSVDLLSRLAPMILQLEREAAEDRLHQGSGDGANSIVDSATSSEKPSINLRLGYHLFSMGEDSQSSRFCLGDGRYCSFPVDEPPSVAEHVNGRAVVEETLLQLCVAEYALSEPASPNSDSSRALQQHFKQPFWSYLDAWCRDCSGADLREAEKRGSRTGKDGPVSKVPEKESVEPSIAEAFLPFDSKCSLKKLKDLGIPVERIGAECGTGDNAEALLQRQIDLHLSRVPALLINGKEMAGNPTPESVIKSLCEAAARCGSDAAVADGVWPLCRTPAIVNAPSLTDTDGKRRAGRGDDVAVAAHLLNTYGKAPVDSAAALASRGGGEALAMNDNGVYRLKNVSAVHNLRTKLNVEKTEALDAVTAAAIFERDKKARRSSEQTEEPVLSIGPPGEASDTHIRSTPSLTYGTLSRPEGVKTDLGDSARISGGPAQQKAHIPSAGNQLDGDWLFYAGLAAFFLVAVILFFVLKNLLYRSKHMSVTRKDVQGAPTPAAERQTSDNREKNLRNPASGSANASAHVAAFATPALPTVGRHTEGKTSWRRVWHF
ncbi:putative transmembrane protein [Toxoplasma gondii GAB2-2007-GAL-DOM2]|uniref:Transmembrane protein n=6 Tax=Toxoplasma gondii TaxID=5811 RepID=S7V3A4_TOXGG|nr:hypothetical protein TGGT1_272695 [Toxoplasma gondii GT1]KAF4642090.1 hypothetical protein TGRH88_079030 [Toxoplasma gondii]KFG43103.1 putative transmembrane protein [Toxoplasma gondii GAB2-2007-GAL-DOM2]KFG50207.1 putative transmembrane protein [Toxoplasma gondii FOU]KFH11739.1 putative transmembrane protein [Toxoplasma gondii VAND]PUA92333.1 putative transmembrane protein [Toxoplasma gondii TgCATBr9]